MTSKPDLEPVATLVERPEPVAFAPRFAIQAMQRGATLWDTTLTSKPDEKERTSVPLYSEAVILSLQGERDDAITARDTATELMNEAVANSVKLAEAAEASAARLRVATEPLVAAAEALSHGTDWNNGTHAKLHGYRQKLIDAIPAARAALSSSEHI
jgi:hypothetical protein